MANVYKSPAWQEIEGSEAVSFLANFGFQMEELGGGHVVLMKSMEGMGVVTVTKRASGLSRPPVRMSDPIEVTFYGPTGETWADSAWLWQFFPSVTAFTKSLGRPT